MLIRSLGLALVLAGAFSVPAKAQSSFIFTLEQQGNNVVGTGSGNVDLDGLSTVVNLTAYSDEFVPQSAILNLGATPSAATLYYGLTGPSNFGTGSDNEPTTSSGDVVALSTTEVLVPQGYVSGTSLSDTATWDDTTLADLGVTPGTYTWTWGTDGENSLTIDAVAVPEPSQYGLGVLLATLGFIAWRRFSVRAALGKSL